MKKNIFIMYNLVVVLALTALITCVDPTLDQAPEGKSTPPPEKN